MILNNPPRDVKIDKENKEKYKSLARKFNKDEKEIFSLAIKIGFFYSMREKIKKPQSSWQLTTFSEEEIKNMIVISYAVLKDINKIFEGKEVIKICEEFANGGVRKLYSLFMETTEKDDVRVIEDLVDEIKVKLNI